MKTYTDLMRLTTFEDRLGYLELSGIPTQETFGAERYLNQRFYKSAEWRRARQFVLARDLGYDLGVEGYLVHRPIIHHMNPIGILDLIDDLNLAILDPEYLITTCHETHNAIHYGRTENNLPAVLVERQPDDTKLW